MRIKLIVPEPLDTDGVAARLASIPAGSVGPDVVVDAVAIERPRSPDDSDHEETLHAIAVVAVGVPAESEGYDAVVLDSITDPGLYALRSRLSIPVVGPGLAACTLAVTLGQSFSVVVTTRRARRIVAKTLRLYGLADKCVSVRELTTADRDTPPDGDELRIGLLEEARQAVDGDGADVVVVGSTSLHAAARHLADALPCPVIDPGRVALQIAERTLLLGLSHSKVAFPAPRTVQDEKFSPLLAGR